MFKTKDLELATVLKTTNHAIKKYERVGREVWFYFEDEEDCRKTHMDFINKKLKINPRELFSNHRELKNITINLV